MIALCDKCNRVTDIEYQVKKHSNTIEETYFTCDQCHFHFTCFVTDKKVRDMQEVLKKMRSYPGVTTKQLEERQNKINDRMNQLKQNILNNT